MNFGRNKSAGTILYGFHAVREAWLNPQRTVERLYLADQARKGFEQTLLEAKSKGIRRPPPQDIDKKKLEKLVPAGAVHQGIALSCAPLDEMNVQDLIIRADQQENPLFLMLDQVTDPHNIGAILRSACVFGASGIIMQTKHTPAFDGVLAKTACGGLEHVPVALETNLSRAVEALKEAGYFIYGLDERGEIAIGDIHAKSDNKPRGKSVLVLGAEGAGLRRLIKDNCDMLVHLPAPGPIQSLNVSNAAAVALYALKNQ